MPAALSSSNVPFGMMRRALPVFAAVDQHEHAAVAHRPERLHGIARMLGDAHPQHVHRRAEIFDFETGALAIVEWRPSVPTTSFASIVDSPSLSLRAHAGDATAVSTRPVPFGLHQQMEVGIPLAAFARESSGNPIAA